MRIPRFLFATTALAGLLLAVPAVQAATVWDGPTTDFHKVANGDPTDAANQDRITDQVWITRADTAGIFNIQLENFFSGSSPADTEWAFADLNGNPANVSAADYMSLNFDSWTDSLGGQGALRFNIVDRPGVLHLISEDIYIDITFTIWGGGAAAGGEFAYTRSTASVVPLPGALLFLLSGAGTLLLTGTRRKTNG